MLSQICPSSRMPKQRDPVREQVLQELGWESDTSLPTSEVRLIAAEAALSGEIRDWIDQQHEMEESMNGMTRPSQQGQTRDEVESRRVDMEQPEWQRQMSHQDARLGQLEDLIHTILARLPEEPREKREPMHRSARREVSPESVRGWEQPETRPHRRDDLSEGFGRYKPQPPEKYAGQRDSLILRKFFRETEEYLEMNQVSARHWIKIASRFLTGDAFNWLLAAEKKG